MPRLVADDGQGMTFEECEFRYLKIGINRRENHQRKRQKRTYTRFRTKGYRKVAGFGIAAIHYTISAETGERTLFELDLAQLRTDEYFKAGGEIDVLEYEGPHDSRN